MKIYVCFMLILSILNTVFAQECTHSLSGKVIDFHDGSPLVGATVSIVGLETSVLSNRSGEYFLDELCNGTYELEVSHPECATTFIPIEIAGNTAYTIKLEHHLEELREVKVFGDAILDKTNSALEESLASSALEKYSSASLGDALKELGGVSTLNTGANIVKPAIHGLSGSRVLILNDGVRMQDMEWGDEHAPNIDINSTGTVTVVKGASALKYGGDAIGGVIVLEQERYFTKDTLFGKTLLTGASNGRGGSLSSELTKTYGKGWFIKGQGSYKRLGDNEAPNYVLSNTGIQEIGATLQLGKQLFEWGIDARYSYYDAEIAILRASHVGNVDDLIRSINSGQPEVIRPFTYDLDNPRQKVRHHLGKVKGYKRFEGLGKWTAQYDFQNNRRFEFDIRRGERSDQASVDLELKTHTLASDFKWDSDEKLELQLGVMGRYQDNFANPATGVRRLIPDYEKYDLGTFLIGEYRINNKWTLDAGIRYDYTKVDAQRFYGTSRWLERNYDVDFENIIVGSVESGEVQQGVIDYNLPDLLANPVFYYSNLSATAGFQYYTSQGNGIKFNYALAQRAPNPSELFSDGLHHSAARIELGDLRIGSETSHKFSLSKEQTFEQWGFSIEPYANFISDFILLEPTGIEFTLRGAFPIWSYRQTNARILGLDVTAYSNWSQNWQTEHLFSLVKGNDVDNDIALINIPSANLGNKLIFNKPEWNDLELSLRSNYVFRQNETPPNISVFSPTTGEEILLEINQAPAAYHLLDLYSEVSFDLGDRIHLTTSLAVNNLLNTDYRDYLNRQRFFADDLGRNIILQLKLNY